MKRTKEDEKLSMLLKQSSHQPEENEWFTPRVVNRLPEKRHSHSWMKRLLYFIIFAGCIGGWIWAYNSFNFKVITVRDLLNVGLMGLGTIIIVAAAVIDIVRSSE